MSVIVADKLGKCYKLGQKASPRTTFREMLIAKTRAFGRNAEPSEQELFWALRDVSFEMNEGEVLGIIGRNGAGKSTLLKLLSRIVEPTEGWAQMQGRVAALLEVGTGFHQELTGRENIYLNGAILGMRKTEIDRKFDEIVDFSGVEKFLDTPVKRYSSGMYVRLAFAVAAHLEPDILIVDEVLAVGDAQFQEKCMGKMRQAGLAEGRTVLFVSHNMPAVRSLCKRALLLDHGKVVLQGDPEYVVDQYLHAGLLEIQHEKTWPITSAPGNEKVRMTRASIEGIKTPLSGRADLSEPLTVTIEYEVLQPGPILNVCFHLLDKHDMLVFSSPSMSDERWYGKPHPVGHYISRCTIPGNFLNDGHYSVTPMVNENQGYSIAVDARPISIQLIDTGENRESYFGHWPGPVRPILRWATERIDSKSIKEDKQTSLLTSGV